MTDIYIQIIQFSCAHYRLQEQEQDAGRQVAKESRRWAAYLREREWLRRGHNRRHILAVDLALECVTRQRQIDRQSVLGRRVDENCKPCMTDIYLHI
eukprot:COSAG05_NODE_2048_length_3640_cov_5.415619_6_plen_97_part_00